MEKYNLHVCMWHKKEIGKEKLKKTPELGGGIGKKVYFLCCIFPFDTITVHKNIFSVHVLFLQLKTF